VLTHYIENAEDGMERAKYSAMRERSVGLGVMGFHSFLQSKNLPFESAMAKAYNLRFFRHIKEKTDEASLILAAERGACPDAFDTGAMERFSCKTAIAPTASISIIAGGASACIEPIPANIYTHKTLSGSFVVKNPALDKVVWEYVNGLCAEQGEHQNIYDDIWNSILEHDGSVQHLEWMNDRHKAVFKTSFEIDQRWILEFAGDRASYIDQAQSLNLFIPADVAKWDLAQLHYQAWKRGIKSLYYLRSKSVQRAGFAGGVERDNVIEKDRIMVAPVVTDYEECVACQ